MARFEIAVSGALVKLPGMPESAEEIANCHACGSPMNVTAVAPFSKVVCPRCGEHTRVKSKFGPYTLLRRHAIGGMSVVFVAHDTTLNREVAVKILNENYSADARRIAAFEEEARITASFSHPHVVRVFTTGRAFDRFFIAMELVVGGHFEHQINERGTIPEREMLPLAIQVAEGLKAALAAGLIHRDIKPGNILLDSAGNAKIVDFGLALLLDKGGTVQAQEIWATPYYVPPETIEGQPEDFRSDMYAFGATMYHALAGKPSCNEESMATNILREAKKKVVPLHTAAARLSPQTCAVVERAMAYMPAKRFQSYDEMIARLNDALKSLRTITGSPPKEPTLTKRREAAKLRSERMLTTAGGVAILGALAGSAWWIMRDSPKPHDPPLPPQVGAPIPTPGGGTPSDPATATRIAKLYREARAALEGGEYDKARKLFASLRDDAVAQEPTRTWAGVEAVVMPYLDGKAGEARKEAKATAAHAAKAQLGDPAIRQCLLPVLEKIDALPAIAATASEFSGGAAPQAMAWLLAGLKNWEMGNLSEAARFFTAVSTLKLTEQDSWAGIYQKIAGDYLADFKALSRPVFDRAPQGKKACAEAIDELNAILTNLKTHGRARFNVNAWRLDLERQARLALAPPTLATVLETVAKHASACTFTDASSYLESLPADPGGASIKSLRALTDAAAMFLSDLATDLKRGEVTLEARLKSGETFAKAAAAESDDHLLVTFASGLSRECAWGELAPAAVIDLYRSLIKNPQSDEAKLRRHESAIAFEWLAGERSRAVLAAERLAQDNPGFKGRWKSITEGLPK